VTAIDPVLAKRARIARLVSLGQRVGYLLFLLSVVLFFVGIAVGLTGLLVTLIVAAIVAGSLVLAPAIVFGYGVKAADRDDREHGRL
jgi:membrane-bound ClpP family serine protease